VHSARIQNDARALWRYSNPSRFTRYGIITNSGLRPSLLKRPASLGLAHKSKRLRMPQASDFLRQNNGVSVGRLILLDELHNVLECSGTDKLCRCPAKRDEWRALLTGVAFVA
jgi:hypothetical protein